MTVVATALSLDQVLAENHFSAAHVSNLGLLEGEQGLDKHMSGPDRTLPQAGSEIHCLPSLSPRALRLQTKWG